MFTNSDLNSDCKQCTESKLGWVHNAHTQGPMLCAHCAHAACMSHPGRRVVAHWAPYRGAFRRCRRSCCSVHWSCRRPCRALFRPPCHRPVTIQKLYRDSNPCRAHCASCRPRCRACHSTYRRVLGVVSQPLTCSGSRHMPSYHYTNHCIATHPNGQAVRAQLRYVTIQSTVS